MKNLQNLNFLVIITLVNLNLINNSCALDKSGADTGGGTGAGFAGAQVFTPTPWGCQFKAGASPRVTATDAARSDNCVVDFGSDKATGARDFVGETGRVVGLSAALEHTEYKPVPVINVRDLGVSTVVATTRHKKTAKSSVRPLATVTETDAVEGAGVGDGLEVQSRTRSRSGSSDIADPMIVIARALECSSACFAEQLATHKREAVEQERRRIADDQARAADQAADKLVAARAARCNNFTMATGILTSVGAVAISGAALWYQANGGQ